jgi:phosphonate ABC transporter permease subunit PhnE
MLETIMIGLMATFFGVILAFPFSFIAARNLMEPISGVFYEVVGGLVGLVPAAWLLVVAGQQVSLVFGGLAEAPIQIAGISLLLLILFWIAGWRLGQTVFRWIGRRSPPFVLRIITAIGFGLIAAAIGYVLGIGFTRGIVSIPLAGIVPENLENRNALIGAVVLGLLALAYGYRKAVDEFSSGMVVYSIARTVMNIVRSIEPLIWAIIGTIWVGLGPFAGTIALTLHTIAALGKLYSESIESIDAGPIEALQATGANRLQTIVYAVVPQILPPFISFTIYRWDINVRMSTIIGAVGGGGIGFILIQWIRLFNYESAGLAVWLITITVATLDYVSSNIRERFI